MFGILARLLEILYSFWPSYAGSIILFTVVIMLVLAPLTFKSTRSMLAMQALQPEMKKLQNRYKDDRQKLNEEMMKFYQENKISPLGGCLPMIIQLPVFFILYAVLLGLTKRGPFGGDLGHSVACSIDGVNSCVAKVGTYADAGFFHPAYLKHSSDLFRDLSTSRVMNSFGLDLSQSAWSEFAQGLMHALPYLVMVLVVMALTYIQQQQIQRRQPKNADQNPTQQMMMKIMPVAMGFIYIIIPAGVVIYFLVSSVFRIGQQAMVTRTFYTGPNAIAIPTTATDDDDAGVKQSSWERFKDTLPQVSEEAKQKRSKQLSGSAKSGKSGKSATGGAGSGGSKKSQTPTKSKGAKGSSTQNATGKRTTTSSKPKSKQVRPEASNDDMGATTAPSTGQDVVKPSRKAPSRKAPQGPSKPKK